MAVGRHRAALIGAGFVLAGSVAAVAAPTSAADSETAAEAGRRLDDVRRALGTAESEDKKLDRRAGEIDARIAQLRQRLVAAATAVREREVHATALENRLASIEADLSDVETRLAQTRPQAARAVAALQRLAVLPPEALLVGPTSSADTIRAAILLRAAVPALANRWDTLRQDLDALSRARTQAAIERQRLDVALADLTDERRELEGLLAEQRALRAGTVAAQNQVAAQRARLASEAEDLKALLARLMQPKAAPPSENRSPRPSAPPIDQARGRLLFPAEGRVVGRYGDRSPSGLTAKGITVEVRPGAQVVAPYDGRIAFAGPFRGYGRLLIIEHGDAYHTLVAGLARIDSVIGQWVVAGEPIGGMGHPERGNPSLYVELRRNGQPINPLPWLAARKDKVRG